MGDALAMRRRTRTRARFARFQEGRTRRVATRCFPVSAHSARATRLRYLLLLLVLALCVPSALRAAGDDSQHVADALVKRAAVPGGVCVLVQPADRELATALSKQGNFVVHMLLDRSEQVAQQRRAIREAGRYGSVSVHAFDGPGLPYTDNLVNLVVVDTYPTLRKHGLTAGEVLRIVAPLGTAWFGTTTEEAAADVAAEADWIGELRVAAAALGYETQVATELPGVWVRIAKSWPDDIDQWTHFLHGADGNPVARDEVVGPPRHCQWTGGPRWLRSHETDSSISTMVTAQGRLFYIVDEAPISVVGDHPLPDKWFLVARDAFNGVPLWKVPIRRWGWREWKYSWFATRPGDYPFDIRKRLVAIGDKVYVTLGYRAPVSQLDARTGELLRTFAGTENTSELLVHEGTLFLSVHEEGKLRVMAIDIASGKTLWRSANTYLGSTTDYLRWKAMYGSVRAPKLSPAANLATDGNAIALIDGDQIVALDARTGKQRWRAPFPRNEEDQFAGGIRAKGKLWNGTMIVSDGVVIHASPQALGALSARTGELLWMQPKKYIGHLWYEWKDVFVIDGLVWTWSAEFDHAVIKTGRNSKQRQQWPRSANGYDLHTGSLKREVPVGNIFRTHHHHRCYRNKATSRYILASRRGTECVDLRDGKHTVDNWVRGTCHIGMMPANGLQYVPPHPCQCYIEEKLVGMNVLAARLTRPDVPVAPRQRFETGPAYENAAAQDDAAQDDAGKGGAGKGGAGTSDAAAMAGQWPAFRHDAARTGSVETHLPDSCLPIWSTSLGGKLSAPTVAGGGLFVAQIDQHHVVCLDAATGVRRWEFAAGGRVDSPPTYFRGRVLFGSRDGSLYCLDAASGQLAWRYQVAPCRRWIGAFGQLESAWPVHGSVLVQNGVVYCVAGRSSQLDGGLHLVGLDAMTGRLLHTAELDGPYYTVANLEENYGLPMGALPDVLVGDGTRVFMRSIAFDAQLRQVRGKPELTVDGGYLDDSYFKRAPWKMGKKDYGRLIVHDNQSAFYVRQFDSLRGLDPSVFFTPGKKGYLLFANNLNGTRDSWRTRIPVRIRAMVLAGNQLLVAGSPDKVDPKDPLGAFEGREGGQLWLLDAASGKLVNKYDLDAPPVFNGAAAAAERIYIVDEDGAVTCLGAL